MKVKVGFTHKGKTIGEYPIDVNGPDDLGNGLKLAFDEFRRNFPKLSLLDDGVEVCFSKLE